MEPTTPTSHTCSEKVNSPGSQKLAHQAGKKRLRFFSHDQHKGECIEQNLFALEDSYNTESVDLVDLQKNFCYLEVSRKMKKIKQKKEC